MTSTTSGMTSTTSGTLRQTKGGQFVDAATLIALLFITLFVTTFVFAQEDEAPSAAEPTAISELNISQAEKEQFELMKAQGMVDDETVAELTRNNAPSDNKYTIEWLPLIGIIALAAAYLAFVYSMSFREFREVIIARFGSRFSRDEES
jgi:Na+/H+ antiporter NhaC